MKKAETGNRQVRPNLGMVRTVFGALLIGCVAASHAGIVPPAATVGESPITYLEAASGHRIDLLTGFASFRNVDLVVPGNGGHLPINVTRVYDINRSSPSLRVPQTLGNWDLELPRITAWRGILRSDGVSIPYGSSVNTWSSRYCHNPVYSQGTGNARYDLYYWIGLNLEVPGAGARSLVFDKQTNAQGNEVVVYPNINVITGTKGNAKYISTDNWRADCLDLPQGTRSGFTVFSPDGTKYTFDKFASPQSKVNETWGWWHSLGVYIYASRVEDVWGNYLTYDYESDANGQLYVSQITASDGRRVRFNYETQNHANHPFWKPKYEVKRLASVEHLSDSGATVLARIDYWYYATTVGGSPFTGNGTLSTVRLPDGRMWNYDYEDTRRAPPGVPVHAFNDFVECEVWAPSWMCLPTYSTYPARLIAVDTPDGITYRYFYHEGQNQFGRVNPRAFSANGAANFAWYIDKIGVDLDLDGNTDFIDLTLSQTYNRYTATVDYPWGRRDLYSFYPMYFAEGSINSHARFADPRGSLLATQEIFDTTTSTPVLMQKTDYDWRRDRMVGDNAAECWIGECDKPDLWIPVLLTRAIQVNGKTFTTSHSDFTRYGHARAIDEYGVRNRSTRLTINNDTTRWIIGNIEREETVGEGVVSRTFNAQGAEESITELGVTREFEYHPTGDLYKEKWRRVAGGTLLSATFEDYKRGIPRRTVDALGNASTRAVNDAGTVANTRNRRGTTLTFMYDSMKRLTNISRPEGYYQTTVNWFYYHPREVREATVNLQKDTRQDQHGRIIWSASRDTNLGSSVSYMETKYDKASRPIFESRPSGTLGSTSGIDRTYDALGRILRVRDTVSGHQYTYCYGTACNAARPGRPPVEHGYVVTDSEGYETIVNFEAFGAPSESQVNQVIRQSKLSPATYITTGITRNLYSQPTHVTQGNFTRVFEYNSKKQLVRVTEPETGITTMDFDLAGNMISRSIGGAPAVTYVYNDRNELKRVVPSEAGAEEITYDYDVDGNLVGSTQGAIVRTASYDVMDQLDTESLTIPGATMSWKREYDVVGNLRRLTYPTGTIVNLQPNAFGQPKQVSATIGALFSRNLASAITYTPSRQLSTFNYGNTLSFSRTENTRGFLDQVRVRTSALQPRLDLRFAYDGRGNITGITDGVDASGTRNMSYDGLERLLSISSTGGSESFEYDDVGNLRTITRGGTSTTLSYDANNRLSSTTAGRVYQYDARGNIASNGSATYLFDGNNQLRELGGPASRSYLYDGGKYRTITRNGRDDTVSITSLTGLLLTELDRRTGESRDYVYLGKQPLAVIGCARGAPDADNDGIPNCFEVRWGMSEQSAADASADADGDGVANLAEYQAGTNPRSVDSDGDGMPDAFEIRYGLDGLWNDASEDLDRDRVSNINEYLAGSPPNFNPAILAPILQLILE
jgi:YD repeat-containing protein